MALDFMQEYLLVLVILSMHILMNSSKTRTNFPYKSGSDIKICRLTQGYIRESRERKKSSFKIVRRQYSLK